VADEGHRRSLHPISVLIRVLIAFVVIVPASIVYIALCIVLLPFSRALRIIAGNQYGKILGPLVYRLAGANLVFTNRERVEGSKPAIFVCNHASTIDMWVGMWLCPYRGCGTAKKEIVKIPFFGQAYLLSGHLLLDRGNREKAIRSMAKAAETIHKHGLSVWMWPEGTRSRDGRLKPLKKGVVHLAIATGLPIVPIVFHRAHHIWPGRTWRITPGALKIDVLEPIDTSGWAAETAGEHAVEIWAAFNAQLGDDQKTPAEDAPAA